MSEFLQELDELERNLAAMLSEDDLYWLRNDAKFRAVEQTDNYQEFDNFVKVKTKCKEIVLGA